MLRCVGLIHNSTIPRRSASRLRCYLPAKEWGRVNHPRAGRFEMLSRRQCPHTGIVNFFTHAEPLFAVGSVIKAGSPARYHWRYYLGEESTVGVAADMRTAENNLINSHRQHVQAPERLADASDATQVDRRGDIVIRASAAGR